MATKFKARQREIGFVDEAFALVGERVVTPAPAAPIRKDTSTALFPFECPRCGHLYAEPVAARHFAIMRVECPGGSLGEIRRRA